MDEDFEFIARLRRRLTGGAELPIAGRHIWGWFCELCGSRTAGMASNPLTFMEIEAWARLTGVRPNPFEIRLLKAIDALWMSVQGEKVEEGAPPRKADGSIDYEAIEDMIMAFS